MLNPNLHQTQNTHSDSKTRRLLSFNNKQPLKKIVGANPKTNQNMYLTSTSKTTTKRKSDKNMSKSLPTTFPKNASTQEPILHWYQWQVHKVPSRPMVLLWNLVSLVPKPRQQRIPDHPGSWGGPGWVVNLLRNHQ